MHTPKFFILIAKLFIRKVEPATLPGQFSFAILTLNIIIQLIFASLIE